MWKEFTNSIRRLLRGSEAGDTEVGGFSTDSYELLKALGVLFEAKEGEGIEFLERLEKEHPNSRIFLGKHKSRMHGLVFPEGYSLQEWIAHRGREVQAESEIDSDNGES
jgi:hypothetical protein